MDYASMKVGELRMLCKARGLNADERKETLISILMEYDLKGDGNAEPEEKPETITPFLEDQLSPVELRELATIQDEMRHLRRQLLAQVARPAAGQFVHQGYSANRR